MRFSEGGYRPKSPEEIGEQFKAVSAYTDNEADEGSLLPRSEQADSFLEMPIEKIKEKYPYRYSMYVELLRHKRSLDNENVPRLHDDEIDEMKKWLQALNSLDTYITNHYESGGVLKERQAKVFEDLRDFIEKGGSEGYVKLPTGVGKTVLFTEFIEALDLKTLIVVPTRPLIKQTEEKIEQFAGELDVGLVYGQAKNYGRQVTITTYDSLVAQVKSKKIDPEEYDCLILDEVHTSLSEQRMKTVQEFYRGIKVGFTATPEFSGRKKVSHLLETEIHQMTVREAVEEGLLCPLSALVAKTEVDLSKVKLKKDGEYDEEMLEKAINVAGRNKAAADLYKTNFDDQLALAYCVGIKHARAVAKTFKEHGVAAAHVSGSMSPKIQEAILDKFKSGEIKVLCNADLLIAGFDEPKASLCLNLRPTNSPVVAEQRGGRVLRLDPEKPEKHATIIDFLDQKDGRIQNSTILFASIVDGVHIENKTRPTGVTGKGGGSKPVPVIDVPGLEIITDVKEIMRIVKEKKGKEKGEFLSFSELRQAVQLLKISSLKSYSRERVNHPDWPSDPYNFYKDSGWIDSDHFFGRDPEGVVKKISLDELRKKMGEFGIKNIPEYNQTRKTHPEWPANPYKFYKKRGWISWSDFFGNVKGRLLDSSKIEKISLDELKKEVRKLEINTIEKYDDARKTHPEWPASPNKFYLDDGWKNWSDLFGPEAKHSTLEVVKAELRGLRVTKRSEYYELRKAHPKWPSSPDQTYKEKGWQGWSDFFGIKK